MSVKYGLEGQVAVITGAANGFGLAVAERLAAEGARLVLVDRDEPALAAAAPMERFQFERLGYFCVDPDSAPGQPIFNRTVALKDTWAKIEKRGKGN